MLLGIEDLPRKNVPGLLTDFRTKANRKSIGIDLLEYCRQAGFFVSRQKQLPSLHGPFTHYH
jgi:hypothetical protein